MNELIKNIAGKTGISDDQAQQAVNAVLAFLKDKLPAPVSAQLDSLLDQGGDSAADIAKSLGSKLGL